MAQVARNLTAFDDGFLRGTRHLILDLDTKFTAQFQRILTDAGVAIVRTAYQAPNMNAFAERWIQSVKRECLDHLILFGAEHLRRVLREYCEHYHRERPHQGRGNEPLERAERTTGGRVLERERLGGLLRSYQCAA